MPIINKKSSYILEPDDTINSLYIIHTYKNGIKLMGVMKLNLLKKEAEVFSGFDKTGKIIKRIINFDKLVFEEK